MTVINIAKIYHLINIINYQWYRIWYLLCYCTLIIWYRLVNWRSWVLIFINNFYVPCAYLPLVVSISSLLTATDIASSYKGSLPQKILDSRRLRIYFPLVIWQVHHRLIVVPGCYQNRHFGTLCPLPYFLFWHVSCRECGMI